MGDQRDLQKADLSFIVLIESIPLGEMPMKSSFILSVVLVSTFMVATARTQVTLDVAKITCHQFLNGKVGASVRSVSNWLSGYYNGKRGNTVIEVSSMRKNEREVERYCRKNPEANVMDAAKQVLGAEK